MWVNVPGVPLQSLMFSKIINSSFIKCFSKFTPKELIGKPCYRSFFDSTLGNKACDICSCSLMPPILLVLLLGFIPDSPIFMIGDNSSFLKCLSVIVFNLCSESLVLPMSSIYYFYFIKRIIWPLDSTLFAFCGANDVCLSPIWCVAVRSSLFDIIFY